VKFRREFKGHFQKGNLGFRILPSQPTSAVSAKRAAERTRSAGEYGAFLILFVSARGVIQMTDSSPKWWQSYKAQQAV